MKTTNPLSDGPLIVVDSCDQSEAVVCTPGSCSGGCASEWFRHLGTRNIPPLTRHPQERLINPLPGSEP